MDESAPMPPSQYERDILDRIQRLSDEDKIKLQNAIKDQDPDIDIDGTEGINTMLGLLQQRDCNYSANIDEMFSKKGEGLTGCSKAKSDHEVCQTCDKRKCQFGSIILIFLITLCNYF